jgi:hypothetical protein
VSCLNKCILAKTSGKAERVLWLYEIGSGLKNRSREILN